MAPVLDPDGSRLERLVVTDVAQLRALTHPLRTRLLALLRTEGPATASALGRRVGESSGSTSYHLRQLERHGFVEPAAEQPSRREKRWASVARMTTFAAADFADDPAGREAENGILRNQVRAMERRAEHWLATRHDWPAPWLHAADSSDWLVRLTPEALRELSAGVQRLVAEAEAASVGHDDVEVVLVHLQAHPTRVDDIDP